MWNSEELYKWANDTVDAIADQHVNEKLKCAIEVYGADKGEAILRHIFTYNFPFVAAFWTGSIDDTLEKAVFDKLEQYGLKNTQKWHDPETWV